MSITTGDATNGVRTGLAGRFADLFAALGTFGGRSYNADYPAAGVSAAAMNKLAQAIVDALNNDKVDLATQVAGTLGAPLLISNAGYAAAPCIKTTDTNGGLPWYQWSGGNPGQSFNLFWNNTTWEYGVTGQAGIFDWNTGTKKWRVRTFADGTAGGTVSDSAGLFRTALEQEAWIAPTLLNSWTNLGGSDAAAGYKMDSCGNVWIKGALHNGTLAANTVLFNLPAAYRPSEHRHVTTQGFDAPGTGRQAILLGIRTNGDVQLMAAAPNAGFISMDCSFAL